MSSWAYAFALSLSRVLRHHRIVCGSVIHTRAIVLLPLKIDQTESVEHGTIRLDGLQAQTSTPHAHHHRVVG
jgi:hypothetical protein